MCDDEPALLRPSLLLPDGEWGGLQAIDNGDCLYFASLAVSSERPFFFGLVSSVVALPSTSVGARRISVPSPCFNESASSLSSSRERFEFNVVSDGGGGKLNPWLAKCRRPLLPLEHFIKSSEAEEPGLKCPTELLALTDLSLPVVNGSCADATEDKESKDASLDGVGMEARLSASAWCASVGEFVKEDELLAG